MAGKWSLLVSSRHVDVKIYRPFIFLRDENYFFPYFRFRDSDNDTGFPFRLINYEDYITPIG